MKALSILDLIEEYVYLFYHDGITNNRISIIDLFQNLLRDGMISKDIMEGLNELTLKTNYQAPSESQFYAFFKKKKRTGTNILKPDVFYYHNQLRVLPPPPRVTVDYNTGQISREVTEYFLEMRASYTVGELLNYYHCRSHTSDRKITHNRFIGSLEWLLKHFDIDELLFMIDAMVDHITNNNLPPPEKITILTDYETAGKTLKSLCECEAKACGGDKIVPKRRISLDRRGYRDTVFQSQAYACYS